MQQRSLSTLVFNVGVGNWKQTCQQKEESNCAVNVKFKVLKFQYFAGSELPLRRRCQTSCLPQFFPLEKSK